MILTKVMLNSLWIDGGLQCGIGNVSYAFMVLYAQARLLKIEM